MQSPRIRLLTWLLVKVLFAALLYLTFAHGSIGAGRVVQFYTWLCFVISLSAFNDDNVRKQQAFGMPTPGWLSGLTTAAFAITLIWFGWGWTAGAFLAAAAFNLRYRLGLEAQKPSVTTPPSVVVHGPQGCGKSLLAGRIAAHFGLSHIVDEWDGCDCTPSGTLYIAHFDPGTLIELPPGVRCLAFAALPSVLRPAA